MRGHTLGSFIKLMIFTAVTLVVTALLAMTIGQIQFRSARSYHAIFSDATSLLTGDDVRIAGVRVGQVKDISIYHRNYARVTFTVQTDVPLPAGTQAKLRFRNLVGQRLVELVPGAGSGPALHEGATIPLSRTEPALNLTALFNGFRPLFRALTPQQVNALSYEIVQTFQGTGSTVDELVANTASLTGALANRDRVIGEVIDNLNSVLGTVDQHSQDLDQLIVSLQQLVSGLAGDRQAIASSLGSIDRLAGDTASLVKGIRPSLPIDLDQLSEVANLLATTKYDSGSAKGQVILDEFLGRLPDKLNTIIRTATYGSWFNFWLCDVDSTVAVAGQRPQVHVTDPVCGEK